jgi:hypothetical protein
MRADQIGLLQPLRSFPMTVCSGEKNYDIVVNVGLGEFPGDLDGFFEERRT